MNVALIGFGVVGQGFVQILKDKAAKFGLDVKVVAVATRSRGSLYHPDGLALGQLLNVENLADYPKKEGLKRGLSSEETITETNADVVVEVSYTNLQDGEPALSYSRAILKAGKHLITANKGPLALAYNELEKLAKENNVRIGYEGTVMSGTPAITLGRAGLAGCNITSIRGIFNGTTNYILTQMELGQSYTEALSEAQDLGYAEADPTADVDGWDTLAKVLILANTVMGGSLKMEDVFRHGISHLTLDQIAKAEQHNQRWKLLGTIEKDEFDNITAKVEPERLSGMDPLANVGGVMNAITYSTDLLGEVTLIGPGAGAEATGQGLFMDLLGIYGA